MANLSEDIQCAGSDTRPPMLDRTDFASWQQRIRLYCQGKENGVNILKSIDEGPYHLGTVRETLAENTEGTPQYGPERPRVYSDLNSEKKDRYNADIWVTNILLQELPKDIYTLINHYTDEKDKYDNVKMLLEGSELTKDDRESQLYDDFEHFRQHKGESIHDYYVRFAKLINDMRNIKMTMSRLQLNSKFVNNMLPECCRFFTAVKLNKGLRDSNYDQLYSYLKQHETHAKENKMMLEPRPGQARPGQARPVKCYNYNGHIAWNCTQPKRPQNSEYYKDKMLLMQAQENGVALDAEQLLFLAGGQDNAFDDDVDEQPIQDLALNVDNVFQADDCDAFDSDVDEAPTTQTMFMANLSSVNPVTDEARPSYDSDILSEVPDHDHYQDAACTNHEEHVMHDSVQLDHVVDSHADYTTDSNMISYDQYVKDNEVPVVHSDVSSALNYAFMMIFNDMCESHAQSISNPSRNTVVKNSLTAELATYKEHVELVAIGYKNPLCLTHAKQVQPSLYNGHEILKENHTPAIVHNTEDTLEIAEITRKKMNDKMNDPECVTRKRITPTGLTKGERGFEQTMECYLKEVIPFFKTLKDNFEGIQKALTKELKEMKDVFEELEAKLNVARFTKMHVANTTVEAHYLALEAELATLRDNNNRDNQKELINHFSKLETADSHITKLTEQVTNLQAQINMFRAENDKIKQHYKELVSKDKVKPQVLAREKHAIDIKPIVPRLRNNKDTHLDYLRHLKESVETIHDIVKEAKVVRPLDRSIVSACRYTKHSQELLEYAIGTCPQGSQQRAKQLAHISLIRKKQVIVAKPSDKSDRTTHKHVVTVKTQKTNVPVPPSIGVNSCPNASGSQPKSTTKTHRISPANDQVWKPKQVRQVWKPTRKVLTTIGHQWRLAGRTDRPFVFGFRLLKTYDGGSLIMNFVKKFNGTVRLGNDHFGAIMGYGEYVIGDSVISRVYYVEGLGHNLFSVRQFCDSDLEVTFRKHSCYVRDTDGVELIKGSRGSNLYTISVEDIMKSSPILPRTPQQNGVVERQNRTLVEAARTMLIFSKAPMFPWAEVVATAVFGALCYPINDSEDLEKLQPTADTGIFVGYAASRKGYRIYNKRT
nr:integrase, catalytic region, zinc finger, CCHC-type, peptidase aspartic, catalytic [Tanacetum cinerariifolium]